MEQFLVYSDEVRAARAAGKPIVALESTIISHGMPYPQNVQTAREVEQIIRDGGAVPATIAIIDFTPDAPVGPPPAARVPRDEVVAEMGRAGYALAATHGFLPYQYFLVFRPR